jgi:hypothetical protein
MPENTYELSRGRVREQTKHEAGRKQERRENVEGTRRGDDVRCTTKGAWGYAADRSGTRRASSMDGSIEERERDPGVKKRSA